MAGDDDVVVKQKAGAAQSDQIFKMKAKSRVALRGWMTRKSERLGTLVQTKPAVSMTMLEDAINEFDKQLEALDTCQEEMQVLIEDENEMLQDIEEAGDYRDKVRVNPNPTILFIPPFQPSRVF